MKLRSDPILRSLVEAASRYPILSPEREREIAIAWHDNGDHAALHELVGSHLRLVVRIARGFSGYGLSVDDLVSAGNIGLMQAAERFDPRRGFRFSTYAIWWIRALMQEYILHSWSLVKIGTTAGQKKLFFNLQRAKARLQALDHGDMAPETVSAIARELEVSEEEVIEMNRRLSNGDSSLHSPRHSNDDGELLDNLVDNRPSQEAEFIDLEEAHYQRRLLHAALLKLSAREREIVTERRLTEDPLTLTELSRRYAISPERIRQIEMRAVEKLQKVINNDTVPSFARRA